MLYRTRALLLPMILKLKACRTGSCSTAGFPTDDGEPLGDLLDEVTSSRPQRQHEVVAKGGSRSESSATKVELAILGKSCAVLGSFSWLLTGVE